jgi:DNA-3-methyladenine glycosylase I
MKTKQRCDWSEKDKLYQHYHDTEWGKPSHDDTHLFEMLCLAGIQAGLSWHMVLSKRENYRKAFDNWDPKKIAKYGDKKVEALMQNAGIIRNRLKINCVITNAKVFLEVQKEFGSFDQYLWAFVDHQPVNNRPKHPQDIPASTPLSDTISKALQKRGFKFVGTTICYAYMQTVGLVNDHLAYCRVLPKK